MLEGVRGSDSDLEALTCQLNALGLAAVELQLDGRRFNILIDDRALEENDWRPETLDRFVELLRALVAASAEPRSVESNLRCVELYTDRTIETLFAVIAGELYCQSQEREPTSSDEKELERRRPALEIKNLSWQKRLGLGLGVLLVSAAVGWQMGFDNLLFPRPAQEIQLEAGHFEGLLEMHVRQAPGAYEVFLRRGPNFPRDTGDLSRDAAEVGSLARHAALNAVGDGRAIQVRLLDKNGELLSAARANLAQLLSSPQTEIKLLIPTHRRADHFELSLAGGN